jgi:hypothetical protein
MIAYCSDWTRCFEFTTGLTAWLQGSTRLSTQQVRGVCGIPEYRVQNSHTALIHWLSDSPHQSCLHKPLGFSSSNLHHFSVSQLTHRFPHQPHPVIPDSSRRFSTHPAFPSQPLNRSPPVPRRFLVYSSLRYPRWLQSLTTSRLIKSSGSLIRKL